MRSTLVKIAILLALFVVLAFVVFVVNQTVGVVRLAGEVSPSLGSAVMMGLLLVYAVLLVVPLVMYLRLPPPLVAPKSDEGAEFEAHLAALRKRLRSHPLVRDLPLETRLEVEAALTVLDRQAEEIIRRAAGGVFLATAVSQSGRLDALLVLGAQSRLVWRVARHYYQRPSARDMLHLYANVAATAFLAAEIDDIDVASEIQPILAATLGSSAVGGLAQSVPFLGAASGLVVNSTFVGATNAFLTLRVGVIAQRYCAALVVEERRRLRRAAVARAGLLLGSIVSNGVKTLVGATSKASVSGVRGLSESLSTKTRNAGSRLKNLWVQDAAAGEDAGADQPLAETDPSDQPGL